MAMKTRSGSLLLLPVLMIFCGHAFAQCAAATGGTQLTGSQISSLLGAHYACGRSTSLDPPGWNELHSGTSVEEQHEGGSTKETVGSWSSAGGSSAGTVTYNYGSGNQIDTYTVWCIATGNGCNPGHITDINRNYAFCGAGGSAPASLTIYVSSAAQTLSSCPSNP